MEPGVRHFLRVFAPRQDATICPHSRSRRLVVSFSSLLCAFLALGNLHLFDRGSFILVLVAFVFVTACAGETRTGCERGVGRGGTRAGGGRRTASGRRLLGGLVCETDVKFTHELVLQ